MERHALVLAQRPIKLGATYIDRNDRSGTALEQAIGKATRRTAHIEASKICRINPKRIECTLELEPAAPHVGNTTLHVQVQAGRHFKARRGQTLAAARDQAGHKSAKGIRAIGADAL